MFAALRRNSHMLPAEHSAEFFGRTSAFAELRPISSLCLHFAVIKHSRCSWETVQVHTEPAY